MLNELIEREVLNTQGKAYGVEFMVRKNSGKLNGWLSYTYSRTFLRTNGIDGGEVINKGAFYPSNYDKKFFACTVRTVEKNCVQILEQSFLEESTKFSWSLICLPLHTR